MGLLGLSWRGRPQGSSLLLFMLVLIGADGQGEWKRGRGTFYGNEPHLWSIHRGSCGYGYIYPDEPLGWDVAALPDTAYDYAGSCGTCYEVRCANQDFNDYFGKHIKRKGVCYDAEASVVVRIVDTCPCNYPDNAFSNKRWCCGDMYHFDLSVWAFEKLASTRWGVIALDYRPVPCNHRPAKPAPGVANPTRGENAPPGAAPEKGKAVTPTGTTDIFVNGLASQWRDQHWWSKVWTQHDGLQAGTKAFCGDLSKGGALSFGGPAGVLWGKMSLEFWVKLSGGSTPLLNLSVAGLKGSCEMVGLRTMEPSEVRGEWKKYSIYLGLFDKAPEVVNFENIGGLLFSGCKGIPASALTNVQFRNDDSPGNVQVCIADMRLK